MRSNRYLRFLEDQIYSISFELRDSSNDWLLMDDNALMSTLPWPPISPDLNPIQNVWKLLKKMIDIVNWYRRMTLIAWCQFYERNDKPLAKIKSTV